jgi:hypothetical protein
MTSRLPLPYCRKHAAKKVVHYRCTAFLYRSAARSSPPAYCRKRAAKPYIGLFSFSTAAAGALGAASKTADNKRAAAAAAALSETCGVQRH